MRRRICKECGAEFQGQGEQRLCPACRKNARQATVMRPRVCISCGSAFEGGPRASYCPNCRAERRKKTTAEYRLRKTAGRTRPLGSVDICTVCGKEYVVNSSLQRYCSDCAPEAVRQAVLPQKRQRAIEHREEAAARKAGLKTNSAVCAYCGKLYTPDGPSVTCSPVCAREYKRVTQGMADFKRGRRKTPPAHQRYDSGLPQSELAGVTYNRSRRKWQVTHKGKYIGLFVTQEEAEAKKRDLLEQPPD